MAARQRLVRKKYQKSEEAWPANRYSTPVVARLYTRAVKAQGGNNSTP